ncbi:MULTISPECIES: DUF4252 domain-containing protein [Sphingobacterium]|jgi:hypothetical protein|uniref:DUF4252 domain-containing protein n=2 Tax=Sphingobacterium TaxID=28453 RepID=A0ABW5Z2M2_9SPHI|nr:MULTISPECIES: DUF4252 domain-containing protein [Sphingobacterium]KKX48977.1 hypothetical protein L950_0218145 [Sphingobacterium sp. IITKGP-BTPF85]MBB2952672.1 hypothetical protein [Sphingobacterium sp. JUb56]MCS3556059.1 hypothetical protein [Sphingobacterium sp. JUb21]MCW2261136.1 hypothetical protein [Sphingobacterium kitahiroshimense]NJI76223.1 DUF4252 domain-containing protein [Sphingobacterium sp. B16(2022)]
MKTILLVLALLCSSLAHAQLSKLDEIFEQYKEGKGVTSIKIGKPMFSMLNKMKLSDNEVNSIKPLLSKINSIKMLILEEADLGVQSDVSKAIGKLKYEELITINSEGNKIKFLAEDTATDVIKNLLLSIQSEGSTIFMILDGKVSYDDVNKLVNTKQ